MRIRSWVLCLLLLLPGARVQAQGATTGAIRGAVYAAAGGAPVVGATVTAVNATTGFRRSAVADAAGRFNLPLLPSGTYRVEARGLGFGPAAQGGVTVRANEVATVELRLGAAAVALEGITATGRRNAVDATQGGVVQTITPEQVANLPTQGRDFTDFLNLSPLVSPQPGIGTGGQFSVAGARTSGTNVQIDGADANNVFFGENRGSSRTPFAFSLESIREFQLITNGFDVEYGNYQGGVVNAVTRGGTNRFQGTVFSFFRDQSLTGDDFSGQQPTDYSVAQFGASVSGPVIRDRLHYFFSVDAQRKDQPVYALTPDVVRIRPDTVQKIIRALSAQGFPNAERTFGTLSQAEDNLVLFGRLDWTVNEDHRLTVRQNFSDFEQTNDRLSASGNELSTRGGPFVNRTYSTVAELNSVLGGGTFNVLRLQYSDEDRPRNPNTPGGYLPEFRIERVPSYRLGEAGDTIATNTTIFAGGDGIIFRNRLVEDKLQLVNNLTHQAGRHTFKVGTNNILTSTENTFFLLGNGSYRFGSLADFVAGRPNQYTRNIRACPVALQNNQAGQPVVCPQLDVPTARFDALEWSVYAQDEWQVTDRLTVTPGIRYGGTSFNDEPGRVEALETAFGVRTGLIPDLTGISPRLAVAYEFPGASSQVLRGGAGLLIGRAPNVLVGNVFQTERPLLSVFCTGANIPRFDLPELLAGGQGENNPAACAGGQAPTGRPEYTLFSDDFELPRTLKANVGYERALGSATRAAVDFIYSRTQENFSVRDLNLRSEQFALSAEGRPVFAPRTGFNPARAASDTRLANNAFNRIFYNVSEGEARSSVVSLELDHRLGEALQMGARYALTRASDNSSFSCCTSSEGFNVPTAGNPNFIGDPGDRGAGAWGPSDFERRHAFVFNALWNAPLGFRLSGIWRSTSGTPWTPVVNGDINGDGVLGNDRAYIGDNLQFATEADRTRFNEILGEFECVREQVGQIARRNSCRNPWFHSVDLRVAKEFRTLRRQRAEFVADIFNVLNGLSSDRGQFLGVFGQNQELLTAERFDAATGNVVYSVNQTFGEERPVGFDPFQFQLQLGVRYRF